MTRNIKFPVIRSIKEGRKYVPVPVVARSKARTVFDSSDTGVMGSNPARGTNVCPRFSVLCFPV
jgi:hypothetical protein